MTMPIRADGAVVLCRSWNKTVRRDFRERLRTIPGLEAIADDSPTSANRRVPLRWRGRDFLRFDKTMVDLEARIGSAHWDVRRACAFPSDIPLLPMRVIDNLRRLFFMVHDKALEQFAPHLGLTRAAGNDCVLAWARNSMITCRTFVL